MTEEIFACTFCRTQNTNSIFRLHDRGTDYSYDRLLEEIKSRDYADSHRANSPLEIAPDAVVIDSSDLTAEQVADYIADIVIRGESGK